ncbi:MAG: GIY-YIG nuclease family protein [bacterium]|nr:GIY-YIG nuclease family protein [bacterium]
MTRFLFLKPARIKTLPKSSGVYQFRSSENEILYIGKAVNLKRRVRDHFRKANLKDKLLADLTEKVGYFQTGSEIEALILEANLIKRYLPKYNVMWRDGKNYLYVGFAKEELPRIFITHQPDATASKLKTQNAKRKATAQNLKLIGPFIDGKSLKIALRLLRRVFPYYVSGKHASKPCQGCLIGLCPGPNPDVREYRKNIRNLAAVLKGKGAKILKDLKKGMVEAAEIQNFEKAARIRDQIMALETIFAHSKTLAAPQPDASKILQKILKSKKPISKIEAYDISNIQGQEATGSMVSFADGKPDKSFYRRFKIKISGGPNDVAMIKEVLKRRLNHPEWPYPDLILIDGGKPQLNAAIASKSEILNAKDIRIIALAKRKNELFIEGRKSVLLLKSLPRPIFNLVLQLRDEAHRFARNYHLKLRRKKFLSI